MKPRKNVSTGASSPRVAPEPYTMPAQLPQTQKSPPSVLQTRGLEVPKKTPGSSRAVIGAALGAVAGAAVAGLSGIPPMKLSLAPSLQANVNVQSIRGEKPNKAVQKEARGKPSRQTESREKAPRSPAEGRNLAVFKANMKAPLPRIKKEKVGQPQVRPQPLNREQPRPKARSGGMKDKTGTRAGPAISRPRAQVPAIRFKQQKAPVKQRPAVRQTGMSNGKKQLSAGPSSNKAPPSRKPVPGSKSSGMSSTKRTGVDTTATSHHTHHEEYSMFSSKTHMSQVDHDQHQTGFEYNFSHGYPGHPYGSGEQPSQMDPLSPRTDTDPETSPLDGPTSTGNPLDQTENLISDPSADADLAEDKIQENQAGSPNALNAQFEKFESNAPGQQVEDQSSPSSNTLDTSITANGPIANPFNDNSSTATQVPKIEKPDTGSAGDRMEGYQPTASGLVGAKQTQDPPSLPRSPVDGHLQSTPKPINSPAGMFTKASQEETSSCPQEATRHAIDPQQTTYSQASSTMTSDQNDLGATPQDQAPNNAKHGSETYHAVSEKKAEFDAPLNVGSSGRDSLEQGVPSATKSSDTPVTPTASFNGPMAQDQGARNLHPGSPGTLPTFAPAVPSWQQQPVDSSAGQQETRGVLSNGLAPGSYSDSNANVERRGDPNMTTTSSNWNLQQNTATTFNNTNSSMQKQYYSTGKEQSYPSMTNRGPPNEERDASGGQQSWKAAAVAGGVAGAAGLGLGLAGGAAASSFMGSSGGPEPQTGLDQSSQWDSSPQYGDHQEQWSGRDHGDQNSDASFDNHVEGPSRSLSPTHPESENEYDRMYDRGLPHGEYLDDNSYEREQSADVNADDDDGGEWNDEDEVQHNPYEMQRSADANVDDGDEWFDEGQAQHNSYEREGFADVNAEDGSEWSDEDETQRRVSSGFDEEFGNGDDDEDSNEASQGEQQFHNDEFDDDDGSETGGQNFQDEYEDSDQQDRESAQADDPDDEGSQVRDEDFDPDMAENSSQNGEGDFQSEEYDSEGGINRDIDEDEDEDCHSEGYDDEQGQEEERSSDDSHAFGNDSEVSGSQDEDEEVYDSENGSSRDAEELEQDPSGNEEKVSEDQQDEYGSSEAERNGDSDADEDVEAEESFQEEDSEEQGLDEEDSEEQEFDEEGNDEGESEDQGSYEESDVQDEEESGEQENYDESAEEYSGSDNALSDNAGLEYADSESEPGQAWQVQEQHGDDGVGDEDDHGGYSDDDGGDDYYE
ncbi:hypothetical protein F5X68DRAFT_254475 [Plectosphaerella plurivora]|uniref:Uncharacterized protein n=1 Tax=Plectosphaerella plurivora TaxID=936078 RepID=A0A9P8VH56_9PEZI|nr:hypothetical protein F5X68DRAFT_254475 [Plectosphaerella plurivora]